MKVRTLVTSLLLIATALVVMSDMNQRASAQTLLINDIPLFEGAPVPDDYEFDVLSVDHTVIGVRPAAGDNFDLEVYEDPTFTTMIESSTTIGDEVDFVVLDKTTWASPPSRAARVTSGSTSYVIEMENDVDEYSFTDTWSGDMKATPGNPVLDIGPPGSWDDVHVAYPSVLYDGGIYKMWYVGVEGSNHRIGYATSVDGINWVKYSGNPVLDIGDPGDWDDERCSYPVVIKDGTTYKMWYSGYDGSALIGTKIGYATSDDGIIWTKYEWNPVLDIGLLGSWDDEAVASSAVIKDGGMYKMWYFAHGGPWQIGYANSTDGINWVKYPTNPVLNTGPPGSWDDNSVAFPWVIKDGGEYKMWYGGRQGGGQPYRVGNATSSDGINWIKYAGNPVMDIGPPGEWDDFSVMDFSIISEGSHYKMWYSGHNGTNIRIGYATSPNEVNWTKLQSNIEVLDAYEITGITTGSYWTIILDVPPTVDLDLFIFNTTGGRDDAVVSSANIGAGINESISFTAPTTGDYLLVVTNEDGGIGIYNLSFIDYPPMITDVTAVPDPQEVFYVVNVSANITDNYQLFGAWAEIYDPDGGLVGYLSMKFDPVNGRYYWNQTYDLLGTYTFTIWANDTSDNWASVSDTFVIHDMTPPTITDVTAVLDPQEVFGPVNISANITDNYQLFGAWVEIYDPDGISVGNPPLFYDQVNGRYYWNQTYNLLGTYSFTIRANDTSDNWASASNTFIIQDTTPPMIADVTAVPNPQEVFYAVNVSANITDNYELFEAWVEIYDPDGGLVGNLSMKYDQVNGRYYWNQIYNLLGTYIFTIWAKDTSDNWASASDTFIIQDTTPPIIADVTAVPNPQEVFYAVNISAIITDNYKLFGAWVEIYDPEGIFIGNFLLFYYPVNGRYYWTQTYDLLGTYTFTIRANDTSNNWASASDAFVIQDTTPPVIKDVITIPSPQEVFDVVNISANITDNYQLSGVWVEIYDPNGISVGNFPLFYDQVNGRYYWDQTYDLLGRYTFTIWANDTSDNWASASDAFVIQDTTPPIITNITTVPDPQQVFGVVNISANVTDNYQLYGVWVEIYDLDGNFIENFSMPYDIDNGRYYWDQTYDIVGIYSFTILANDTSENWASALGSFIIQPTLPPIISDITAEPVPQIVGEEVTISAVVTDEDTDLDYLTVRVNITKPDGTPLGNFTMTYNSSSGKFSHSSNFDMKGNYTFVIWANDTEGNWATENGTFVMEPKSEPREFNWKPIIALIFAIILLILGILVGYYQPVRFTGILERDRWYTFLGGVLPFVIAEGITGIVSFFTGLLSVPPILGLGMILDLVILIAGTISCLVIYKKGVSLESYEEVTQPGPTDTPKIPYEPFQSHNWIIEPPEDPGIPLPKLSEPLITPSPPFQYE